MPSSCYAILLDGGFVIKKLQQRHRRFPAAADIEQVCQDIQSHPELHGLDLLRIYFYHAPPAAGVITNPLDGSTTDLSSTPVCRQNDSLQKALSLKPRFALRLGETTIPGGRRRGPVPGWRLTGQASEDLLRNRTPRNLTANDLQPNITQKGVDLRIGLDLARLSLRQLVDVVVVVTGDSDLIPAFKFARREGLRVYLQAMGHGVRVDLKVHADLVL